MISLAINCSPKVYELREGSPVASPNYLISIFSASGYLYLELRTLKVLFCPCVLTDRDKLSGYFLKRKRLTGLDQNQNFGKVALDFYLAEALYQTMKFEYPIDTCVYCCWPKLDVGRRVTYCMHQTLGFPRLKRFTSTKSEFAVRRQAVRMDSVGRSSVNCQEGNLLIPDYWSRLPVENFSIHRQKWQIPLTQT